MVFVVASDDHKWCQEMFATENDVIMTNFDNPAELDLAILSQCDHSIIRLVLINKKGFFPSWGFKNGIFIVILHFAPIQFLNWFNTVCIKIGIG